jgi:hypothetical protein
VAGACWGSSKDLNGGGEGREERGKSGRGGVDS